MDLINATLQSIVPTILEATTATATTANKMGYTGTLTKVSISSSQLPFSITDKLLSFVTSTTNSVITNGNILNVGELSSSLQHFGWMDYFVFVTMLVACAIIGFYYGFIEKKGKRKRPDRRRGSEALDYLVGGRQMKVFPVSLSLVSSFVSGISLLGTPTEIYVYGTQYAFILVTIGLSAVISWYIFLPVFCNLQLTSTYEYFERRFDRRIRYFGAVLFIIEQTLWLPIAIYVPALTFNQVTGIGIHILSPIVSGICIFYTTVGGLKAVVLADFLQSFVMFGSVFLVIIMGTLHAGGFDVVWKRNMDSGRIEIPGLTFDPTYRISMLSVLIGGTVNRIQGTSISQPAVQRFLSLPSVREIKKCLIFFTLGLTLLLLSCVYVGLVTYATYFNCDPLSTKLAKARDQLVPLLVMDLLGQYPGLAGLFVSAVFSAALSSLSTVLNSMAAVILEDFAKPFSRHSLTERQTAILMRAVVVIFGTLAIGLVFIVERLGMVLQLSTTLQSITQGPILGIFVVGVSMPWVNSNCVLTGSIVSFIAMTWVCIRAQVAIFNNEFETPEKPVSTEGCTYEFDYTPFLNSTLIDASSQKTENSSDHISWLWYGSLGALITMIVSNIASLIFGKNKIEDVDPDLLAPYLQKYFRDKKYESFQMVNRFGQSDLVL